MSGETTTRPADPVDWKPLLQRFAEALAVVMGGLTQMADKAQSDPPTADVGATGPLPRGAELAALLSDNDTRAEDVMNEIRASWTGPQPQWLADAARAIAALDYPGALQRLRAAGTIDPA